MYQLLRAKKKLALKLELFNTSTELTSDQSLLHQSQSTYNQVIRISFEVNLTWRTLPQATLTCCKQNKTRNRIQNKTWAGAKVWELYLTKTPYHQRIFVNQEINCITSICKTWIKHIQHSKLINLSILNTLTCPDTNSSSKNWLSSSKLAIMLRLGTRALQTSLRAGSTVSKS